MSDGTYPRNLLQQRDTTLSPLQTVTYSLRNLVRPHQTEQRIHNSLQRKLNSLKCLVYSGAHSVIFLKQHNATSKTLTNRYIFIPQLGKTLTKLCN